MNKDKIIIKGARVNNLKNIDVEIPRDKLVIMTGLSGSGKTSLAFDTIYAEGQRRYVESLSAYADNSWVGLKSQMLIVLKDFHHQLRLIKDNFEQSSFNCWNSHRNF